MTMRPLFPDITVNGEVISAAEIAAEAQHHTAPTDKPGIAWRKAARALVVRQLCLQAAAQAGIVTVPHEVAPGRVETPEEARIRALLEQEIRPAPVDPTEIEARYESDKDRFRAPSLYEAAHILIAAPKDDSEARDKAMLRAKALLDRVRTNPTSFADLARRESDCASRDNGGLLGQLSGGDTVPEFEQAMERAIPGEITPDLVETRFGFHILRLDARAQGAILPLSAVHEPIRDAIEKSRWVEAASQYTSNLIETAQIDGIERSALA